MNSCGYPPCECYYLLIRVRRAVLPSGCTWLVVLAQICDCLPSLLTCLVSRLAGCTCWKALLDNNRSNFWLNSVITIVLPCLLCSVGPVHSKCTCVVAPLSRTSDWCVFLIVSNLSSSFFSSIRVGYIDDSISSVAFDNSSCFIDVQAAILFEESLSLWYDKNFTIVQ